MTNPFEAPEAKLDDDFADPIEAGGRGLVVGPLEIVDFPSNPVRFDRPRNWPLAIAEAIGWFFGTLFAQIAAGIVAVIAIIIFVAVMTGKPPVPDQEAQMLPMIAISETLFVLMVMCAVSLRYWGRTFHELNLSLPSPLHVLIIVGGTLPLSFCVSAWSMPIQMGWDHLESLYPFLKSLDQLSSMVMVKKMMETASVPLMIFIVAVLPAIGEELVFRGAIGRVLMAHVGIWGSVILTSFLFGWCHIHPVHAIAVMPIGVALHFVYLSTRSFWIPMLLHFSNNCWAVISTKINSIDPFESENHFTWLNCLVMASAVFAVIFLGISLWQSRIRLFHDDGREWNPGRFPLRRPACPGFHRKSSPMNSLCFGAAVVCVLACHLGVAVEVMHSLNHPTEKATELNG